METISYERFHETLYYERLPNGLRVYVLPKEGFQKTYATFATQYGSIDNHFQVGEKRFQVPDGIAHFLEHKMFEEPDIDVFTRFSSQGASANAFTSFDRTVYLFSATENIDANLVTLLDFVQSPYFTDENVEKEKGIIGQEINMYKDNPDWQCYFGLIESLYQKHPIRIDIAGTIDSITQITKEMLYDCYHTFYHPSNMILFVVGGIDAAHTMEIVRKNQASKTFPPQQDIVRFVEEEPSAVAQHKRIAQLTVSMPKCLIGLKEKQWEFHGRSLLQAEVEMKLLLDLLFGSSSSLYQKLYDEGIIFDDFSHEFHAQSSLAFSVVGGNTPHPEKLVDRIQEEIEQVKRNGLDRNEFERSRKKKIGSFLRMLNSPEAIANEFTRYRFRDQDLFDVLGAYEQIEFERIQARLHEHFDWNQMAVSLVQS